MACFRGGRASQLIAVAVGSGFCGTNTGAPTPSVIDDVEVAGSLLKDVIGVLALARGGSSLVFAELLSWLTTSLGFTTSCDLLFTRPEFVIYAHRTCTIV